MSQKIDWAKPIEAEGFYSARYLGTLAREQFPYVVALLKYRGGSETLLRFNEDGQSRCSGVYLKNIPDRKVHYQILRYGKESRRIYIGGTAFEKIPVALLCHVYVVGFLKVTTENGKVIATEIIPYDGK